MNHQADASAWQALKVSLDAQGQLVWQWQQEGQLAVLSEETGGWWRHFNAWISRVLRLEKWLSNILAACRSFRCTVRY